MIQTGFYSAQGIIEYSSKELVQETAQEFDKKGAQELWKERTADGYPIGATEEQVQGKTKQLWIDKQPTLVPVKDSIRDIVPPPYDSEQIDWKRFEKPTYPFAASEWEEKQRSINAWVPNVEAFSNRTQTWTGNNQNNISYASPEWEEKPFEKYNLN